MTPTKEQIRDALRFVSGFGDKKTTENYWGQWLNDVKDAVDALQPYTKGGGWR